MNKYINLFYLSLLLLVFIACDNNFTEINTNPVTAVQGQPELLFGTAILQASGNKAQVEGAVLAYASCFVQHIASTKLNWQGDKYFHDNFHNDSFFLDTYKNELKHIADIIRTTKDVAGNADIYNLARIWRVFIMHRITDLYGDIPYSEAGLGFEENITFPVYDPQENIYIHMLTELEDAANNLPSEIIPNDWDLLYDGDFIKWEKFANSLSLRLALRLSNVNEDLSKEWVIKVTEENDLISSMDDQATIRHEVGSELLQNNIGAIFDQENNGRLCATFINWLEENEDPRLSIIATKNTNGEWLGLPNGLDDQMLKDSFGGNNLDSFSQINPHLIQLNSPKIILSYAEVELMLAEASLRGWIPDDAMEHFRDGTEAAIKQWTRFDQDIIINDSSLNSYLSRLDLSTDLETGLEQIHTQYWAATFLNELEAFANWRRTGYPVLRASDYPGNNSNSSIPRRLRYPSIEYSVNGNNLDRAIERQGADEFITKIWWDRN